MGVQEPQQAQEPNEHDLSDEWIAVDQEGNEAANYGRLDQIENRHNTVFQFGYG